MSDAPPESNPPSSQSFWTTLPGVLTAVGGMIAGIAALLTALVSAGVLGGRPTPIPVPIVVATALPMATTFVPEPTATPRAVTPQAIVVTVIAVPTIALLASTSVPANDVLMADVIEGKHIGQGVVDGVECEHLAFRNADTDWQIWVETGAKPIPRKYVITSKAVAGAPQYALRIKDWKTDAAIGADAFAFKPEADAKKIAIDAMRDFDEVPAGVPVGGKK